MKARVLFRSVVWLTLDTAKRVFKIWDVLLNTGNRLILGAFRTSPVKLMRHDSFLTPFPLVAARSHYNFICKRLTSLDSHPTKKFILHELTSSPKSHQSCITSRIEPELLHHIFPRSYETILPHVEPPWSKNTGEAFNLCLTREEVKKHSFKSDTN